MSTTVDERVVSMKFDNKQFEQNVQTTLSTVSELKRSLKFDGIGKGFDSITAAAKKCDVTSLSNAVEAVKVKFSALEVMAVTTLANITNSAVETGKRIVEALTIDPIKTGFQEYETQINAVQTILANTSSKGTTLDQVNNALDELNHYADMTIYNFTEMTRNIGTFTAAGVDLDTSVSAIKGIANLAAVSGSNSQQASTAMYQLSQALAAGTVKLQDWNSVVNAGMGGQVFQDALKETARVHGIAIDELIEDEGSFRETLQKGWLTSDILTETLSKFTGDLNEEQLRTMGYTEEQIASIVKMGQTANDAATKVKTFTQLFDTLKEAAQSGWTQSWELIVGDFEEAKSLLTNISDVFSDIINTSANNRNALLEGALTSKFEQLTKKINDAGTSTDDFYNIVKSDMESAGYNVDELLNTYGSMDNVFSSGSVSIDVMRKSMDRLSGIQIENIKLTDAMKDHLSSVATEAGVDIDEIVDSYDYGEDRLEALYDCFATGEISASILSTAISQLSDSEIENMGYTEAEIQQLRAMGEIADTTNKSVYGLVDSLDKKNGRQLLIDSLWNSFNAIMSVVNPVKEAFREIFPPTTSEQLYNLIVALESFTSKMVLTESTADNLKRTFKGAFAVIDIGIQLFKAITSGIGKSISLFMPAGNGILALTGNFGDYLVKLDETVKKTDIFGKAISTVVEIIKVIVNAITTAVNKIKEFGEAVAAKFDFHGFELFHSFLERVHDRMAQIGDGAGKMKSGVVVAFEAMGKALEKCKFLQVLESLWNAVKAIGSGIADAVGNMMSTFAKKIGNSDFSGALDILNSIAVGGIAFSISKFLKSVTEPFEGLSGILEGVTGILDGVRGCFETYQTNLKAGTLLKIASAIALLAVSIVAISLIDSDKLSASLGAITVLFANLLGAMAIFNKISGNTGKVFKTCTSMIAMSVAVSILAGALKKVSCLNWEELARGLVGIAGLSTIIVASSKAMSSGEKQIMKGAASLIIFGAAIKILASACKDLSKLQWDELGRGLTGVGVLFAEIAAFLRVAKFNGKMISTATGIVIMAASMKVMASVCKDFAQMEWSEIGKGLAGIGGLLAELTMFTNLTGNAKHVMSTGIALIAIGAAMKIFVSAIKDFSQLQWDELGKGLTAMGGALAEVAIAVNLMPKNMIGLGTGLIIVGGALEIIVDCMSKFGGMQWDEIGKGLTVMGGALAELAIGLNFMKGTLGGSAALLVASAAIAVLTPMLSILGALSWESIAKGLTSIAGAFTIIGVAGAVLAPLVPTILALSGAFALIGVGVLTIGAGLLAAGAGLSALAIGFTALATAGAAGATAIVAALTVIVTGIANLIPVVLTKVVVGIIAICKVIAAAAPAIGEAVKAIIVTLLDVLVTCVPQIADGALQLVVGVLAALVTYTPQIVDLVLEFLIQILEGISNNLPLLIKAGIDVLMAFFTGIVDALGGIDTSALVKGIAGIGLLSAIMISLSAVAALIPEAMVGILGVGAVIAEMAIVLAAVGVLAQLPGLSWLIGEGGKLLQGVGTAIGQFVGGIVGGFMTGVSSQFPKVGADLSAFMVNITPFIAGANMIKPSMMDGVKALAETILVLTAADILQGLTSWFTGGSSLSKFGEELVPFGKAMKDFSLAIGNMDGEIVANAAIAGKTLAEMAATIPNTGGLVSFFAGENDMTVFGKQLVPFGEAMKQFGNVIAGLDANAVNEAAIAGKAMAEMATTIPNSGGVVGFFVGENDMGEFGKQLVPFGEAMKAFGDAVRGLEADAIVNSAIAGKALVELADTVPNTGGVVGFFAGNNDIDTFGEKLVPFGEAMKAYSEAIIGIDSMAITNSATAGKSLVELANTIPNTGGLVSWFTGDNDMKTFGLGLVSFGDSFAKYSESVKNVKPDIVTTTSNAAQSIVELQKSLPKEGGWFSDDQTLEDFGKDIKSFGEKFATFYDTISNIDTGRLSIAISELNRLVNLSKNMGDVDTSKMSNFAKSLGELGKSGIDTFIDAFTSSGDRITQTATTLVTMFTNAVGNRKQYLIDTFESMLSSVISKIDEKQSSFVTAGDMTMTKFISGIRQKNYMLESVISTALDKILSLIRDKYQNFNDAGKDCMIYFIGGLKSKDEELSTAISGITNTAVNKIKEAQSSFYEASAYLVEGFVNGIKDNSHLAEDAAREMAASAADAARHELDEHSPSKVGYQIGDFFGIAFVNAISDYADKSYAAGAEIATSAKLGLSKAIAKISDEIDDNIDTQPTIRPVLDLSSIEAKGNKINSLFNRTQALSIGAELNATRRMKYESQNEVKEASNNNTYSFTQNNYSPKALSRTEIYRQTKNQFSAMERTVKA
jgi:tape measure domain-containing protein